MDERPADPRTAARLQLSAVQVIQRWIRFAYPNDRLARSLARAPGNFCHDAQWGPVTGPDGSETSYVRRYDCAYSEIVSIPPSTLFVTTWLQTGNKVLREAARRTQTGKDTWWVRQELQNKDVVDYYESRVRQRDSGLIQIKWWGEYRVALPGDTNRFLTFDFLQTRDDPEDPKPSPAEMEDQFTAFLGQEVFHWTIPIRFEALDLTRGSSGSYSGLGETLKFRLEEVKPKDTRSRSAPPDVAFEMTVWAQRGMPGPGAASERQNQRDQLTGTFEFGSDLSGRGALFHHGQPVLFQFWTGSGTGSVLFATGQRQVVSPTAASLAFGNSRASGLIPEHGPRPGQDHAGSAALARWRDVSGCDCGGG